MIEEITSEYATVLVNGGWYLIPDGFMAGRIEFMSLYPTALRQESVLYLIKADVALNPELYRSYWQKPDKISEVTITKEQEDLLRYGGATIVYTGIHDKAVYCINNEYFTVNIGDVPLTLEELRKLGFKPDSDYKDTFTWILTVGDFDIVVFSTNHPTAVANSLPPDKFYFTMFRSVVILNTVRQLTTIIDAIIGK